MVFYVNFNVVPFTNGIFCAERDENKIVVERKSYVKTAVPAFVRRVTSLGVSNVNLLVVFRLRQTK